MSDFEDFTPPVVDSLWVDDKGLRRLVTDVTGDGHHVTWRRPDTDKTTRIWWVTWRDWVRKAVRMDMECTESSVAWLIGVGFNVVGVMNVDGLAVINIDCPERHVLTIVGRLRAALSYMGIPLGAVGDDGVVWAEVIWDLGGSDGVITLTGLHDGILPSSSKGENDA